MRDSEEMLRDRELSSLPNSFALIRVLELALRLLCLATGESETTEVAAVEVRRLEGPEAVDDAVPRLLLKPVEGVFTTLLFSCSTVSALSRRSLETSRPLARHWWYVEGTVSLSGKERSLFKGVWTSSSSLLDEDVVGNRDVFCRLVKSWLPSTGLERPMTLAPSSLPYAILSATEWERSESAKGGRKEVFRDSVSEISVRGLCENRLRRETLLGKSTLSSLALPTFVFGSSCSRSMLKRADRPGISRLVRKSSVLGKAVARSNSSFGSTTFFCFRFRLRDSLEGGGSSDNLTETTKGSSFAFVLFLKTFMLAGKERISTAKERSCEGSSVT